MRKLGKTIPLTFQKSWLDEYRWLAYSPSHGGGYCKYCVLLSASTETLGVFVKIPLTFLSRAKGKEGFLNKQQLNEYHQDALCLSMAFLERFVNSDTSYRIDTILEKQSTDISNRHIVCL